MIRFEGLTPKQVEMLDKLWSMDTSEQVLEWMKSLNDDDFRMAVTLQEMVIDALLEQPAEQDLSLAKQALNNIGIRC
jgi:transcriptional regulator of NAD metabolism